MRPLGILRMRLWACTVKEARAFIDENHRHNKAPRGGLFAVAVGDSDGFYHGVGIAGRPVARLLDDGDTIEITRCCTDGTKNVCSMIYGSLCRAAKALGYHKAVTYTLERELGTSLKASNFVAVARTGVNTWNRPNTGRDRVRVDRDLFGEVVKYQSEPKIRWERVL